jgi:hypothetical protein
VIVNKSEYKRAIEVTVKTVLDNFFTLTYQRRIRMRNMVITAGSTNTFVNILLISFSIIINHYPEPYLTNKLITVRITADWLETVLILIQFPVMRAECLKSKFRLAINS